jgi:hypothetical protein
MTDVEKNSLGGFARYLLASKIADANRVFSNILSVLGSGTVVLSTRELAEGESFRLEAINIAQRIPVDVQVDRDQSNRIKGAFAGVISKTGIKSGGMDSRYALNAEVNFTPVILADQPNEFVRYEVHANLVDRLTGNVLLPYTISGREGHLTVLEAENRAVTVIEKEIAGTWGTAFSAYLDSLLPVKK